MSISASHEAVEMQNREMRNGQNPGASAHAKSNAHEFPNATGGVNRLGSFVRHGNSGGKPKPRYEDSNGGKSYRGTSNRKSAESCYRCGSSNHIGSDTNCPAKDKQCNKCSKIGHFAIACRSVEPKKKVHSILSAGSQNADQGQAAFQCKASLIFNLNSLI